MSSKTKPRPAARRRSPAASGRTRRQRKADTRATLLTAARRCFAAHGYAATGIGEITSTAGVASGTFYVHFDDKEALADELLASFNEGLAARLAPLMANDRPAPLRKRVAEVAASFLDHLEAERALVGALTERTAAGLTLEHLRDGVNPPVARLLGDTLARALGAHDAAFDLELAALGLLALWLRLGLQAVFNPAVKRTRVEATLVRMTVGALEALASRPGGSR